MPKTANLFQTIFLQTKELARKAKASLVESGYKTKFISAVINKKTEIAELNSALTKERERIQEESMDIQKLINTRIKITRAEEALQEIMDEYKILFDKDLVIPE